MMWLWSVEDFEHSVLEDFETTWAVSWTYKEIVASANLTFETNSYGYYLQATLN